MWCTRYAAVTTGLSIMTAIIELVLRAEERRAMLDRQLKAAARANSRVSAGSPNSTPSKATRSQSQPTDPKSQSLRRERDREHDAISAATKRLCALFDCTVVTRCRDVQAALRLDIVVAVGEWTVMYPALFMKDAYLKYIAWGMSDKVLHRGPNLLEQCHVNNYSIRSQLPEWRPCFPCFACHRSPIRELHPQEHCLMAAIVIVSAVAASTEQLGRTALVPGSRRGSCALRLSHLRYLGQRGYNSVSEMMTHGRGSRRQGCAAVQDPAVRKAAVEAVTSMLHDEEDALAMEAFLGHFRVRIVETGSDREPSVCLAAHQLLHLLLQHGLVSLQQLLPVMRCAPGLM